jgi:hypothetical protein
MPTSFLRTGHRCRALYTAGAAILFIPLSPTQAEDGAPPTELDRIKAKTELATAKAELATAEAKRIEALGLPSFEGKTTMQNNAGALEVNLLSATAIGGAAGKVANAVTDKSVLLLGGDEAIDFGTYQLVHTEMKALDKAYEEILGKAAVGPEDDEAGGGLPLIPLASAVLGLLRSDTTVDGATADAVTQQMFVTAVANRLGGKAVLPGALLFDDTSKGSTALTAKYEALLLRRSEAAAKKQMLATAAKANAAMIAKIDAVLTRHDSFIQRTIVPNDDGVAPFTVAARMAGLIGDKRKILRVYVNKAGGSIVNSKNLATTLGFDPIKISGGVIASYLLSDPATGAVTNADVIACMTTLTDLREIQQWRWNAYGQKTKGKPSCRSLLEQ